MKLRIFLASAISIVLLFAVACRHLDNWQIHDEFTGMRAALGGDDRLDVLVVHGMGHAMDYPGPPLAGYSVPLQDAIAQGLGGQGGGAIVGGFAIDEAGVRLGQVSVREYKVDGKAVRFYELSWAESLKQAKVALLDLDEKNEFKEGGPLEPLRAPFNSKAKTFVNTHLADPVVYVGAFGRTLRRVAQQAICYMTRRDPPEAGPCSFASPTRRLARVVVVTHSLGSALVFDAVTDLFNRKESAGTAQTFAAAMTHVYMLANQLPLIELRTLRAPANAGWLDQYPCPKGGPEEAGTEGGGLGAFLSIRRRAVLAPESAGKTPTQLSVVAFSDPNDLLTYFITDRFKKHCDGASFANVTVTNASTEWLMLFADPLAAHTGFQKNQKVIRMLVEGGRPGQAE